MKAKKSTAHAVLLSRMHARVGEEKGHDGGAVKPNRIVQSREAILQGSEGEEGECTEARHHPQRSGV